MHWRKSGAITSFGKQREADKQYASSLSLSYNDSKKILKTLTGLKQVFLNESLPVRDIEMDRIGSMDIEKAQHFHASSTAKHIKSTFMSMGAL